jgi:hypothetical protein
MTRGHKPSISSYDRRRWLEQLNAGTGITEIARVAVRDIRVVKRHIEIASEEVVKASVRKEFMLGRLQQHQDDLLDEVERIRTVTHLPVPRTLMPGEARNRIYDAFKEHIKKTALSRLLDYYEETVEEGNGLKRNITDRLHPAEIEFEKDLPQIVKTTRWISGIAEDLISGYIPDANAYSLQKQIDGTYEVRYKDRKLMRNTVRKEDAGALEASHKKLIELAGEYKAEVNEYRQRRTDITEKIAEELDTLALKRMVPGRCRYCPI